MEIRLPAALLAAAMTAVLTGCAKQPPKCSDEATIALVQKLFMDQIGGSDGLTEKEIQDNLKVELPRATALDEKIRKYSCEGKLHIAGDLMLPIRYESQLDDQGKHVVSLEGVARRDLLVIQAAMIDSLKKSRGAKDGTAPQGAASPTTSTEPLPDLTKYAGQPPLGLLSDPLVEKRFKALLADKYDLLTGSLPTAKGVEQSGDIFFAKGCAPQLCGVEEGAFAVNQRTGEVFAAQLMEGKQLAWFGAADRNSLPAPLAEWVAAHSAK